MYSCIDYMWVWDGEWCWLTPAPSISTVIKFVLLASYGKILLCEQSTVLVPFSKVARFGIWMNTDFTNLT